MLEGLLVADFSSLVKCLLTTLGVYPRVEHLNSASVSKPPAVFTNIRQRWKDLSGKNSLTY
jgi:hypothetical protein